MCDLPKRFCPVAVEKAAELWVALQRLHHFLSAPEASGVRHTCIDGKKRGVISVTSTDFKWRVDSSLGQGDHPGEPVPKTNTRVRKHNIVIVVL